MTMIPYYSPNISFIRIVKALLERGAENKVKNFFKELTGKKYVLLTSSCRSSLYLAYLSIGKKNGTVITSPLTCKLALEPLIAAKIEINFCDIDPSTLNMNPDVALNLTQQAFAIQVIHLGGIPNDMDKITKLAKENHLLIIEDCAQALGAFYKGKSVGSFGDIACFSLVKTGYGIGGGVLATDNKDIYLKAKQIQSQWPSFSKKVVIFRLIRSFLETKRSNKIFDILYNKLMFFRKISSSYRTERLLSDFSAYLRKPSCLFFKVFAAQIKHLVFYWNKRRMLAQKMIKVLDNYYNKDLLQDLKFVPSFTKFYYITPIHCEQLINYLWQRKIEAKHLEHKYMVFYQKRFDMDPDFNNCRNLNECVEYFKVHDNLISLPLYEKMTYRQMYKIKQEIDALQKK